MKNLSEPSETGGRGGNGKNVNQLVSALRVQRVNTSAGLTLLTVFQEEKNIFGLKASTVQIKAICQVISNLMKR